jgi:hypothetical protein
MNTNGTITELNPSSFRAEYNGKKLGTFASRGAAQRAINTAAKWATK